MIWYQRHEDVVTREIAGQEILVPVRSRAGELDSVYTLDPTGSTIWQLLSARKTLEQIVQVVCDEYEVDPAVAERDAREFLGLLDEAGLLRKDPR